MDHSEIQEPTSDEVTILAQSLITQGRLDAAKKVLANMPDAITPAPSAIRLLAVIDAKQGKHEAAASHLREVYDLDPSNVISATEYAQALYRAERYSEAKATLEHMQNLSANKEAQANLVKVYSALNWKAHAVRATRGWRGLPARNWVEYSILWLRCGGPLTFWRSHTGKLETRAEEACAAKISQYSEELSKALARPDLAQ